MKILTGNSYLKIEKMEKVPLDIPSKEELSEIVRSFPALYDNSHEGFKEKCAAKNAWKWSYNGVGI